MSGQTSLPATPPKVFPALDSLLWYIANHFFKTMEIVEPMKVLLALSGGVDSAVCAGLLRQAGYDVHGLVIRFSPAHEAAVFAAQTAAAELAIPLTVADCQPLFEKEVVVPFCNAYALGRTPNPCVLCNPAVKFHTLALQADLLGIEKIATGHYARLATQNGVTKVRMAKTIARDQSYMLYRLPPSILSRLLLPAGELSKDEIRALANQFSLSCADAPDSQEICFIPDGDYAAWLEKRGIKGKPGNFISPAGATLGAHQGVIHYTVGQRRGLGLALGRPAFVKSIDSNGDIRLAFDEETLATGLTLTNLCFSGGSALPSAGKYHVKIRSMAKPVECRLQLDAENARLTFALPQRSPAPGQHAVLYTEDVVVGGGIIDEVFYP